MIMMVTEMDDGFDKAAETLNRAHDHDIDSFSTSVVEDSQWLNTTRARA